MSRVSEVSGELTAAESAVMIGHHIISVPTTNAVGILILSG